MNEHINDLNIIMGAKKGGDQTAVVAAYRRLLAVLKGDSIPAPIPVDQVAVPVAPAPVKVQAAPTKPKQTASPYTPVPFEGLKCFTVTDVDKWRQVVRTFNAIVKGTIVYNIESNVHIFSKENTLYIEGTNNEINARCIIGNAGDGIDFLVHAQTLFEMTKKVKRGISFGVSDNFLVKLDIDGSSSEIQGMSSADYNVLDRVALNDTLVRVEAKDFTRGLKESIDYTAKDTFKPLLKGVHYEKGLMIATDGKRLVKTPVAHEFFTDDWQVTLSPDLVRVYLAMGSDREVMLGDVTNGAGEKIDVIRMDVGGWHITSITCEGRYPNYKQVIPKDFANEIYFDANDMACAIEKVEPMIKKLPSKKVSLSIVGMANDPTSKVVLEGRNDEMGTMKADVAMQITGKNVMNDKDRAVAFNYTYLRQIVKDLKGRVVTLKWNNDDTPAMLVGDERTFIVMPMKVEEQKEKGEAA
jgi:DNA polymerase III subunit beta